VAYEALLGIPAIAQDRHTGILVSVLTAPPRRPSMVRSGLPAGLDERFGSALAKEKDARPDDVESWAESCAQLLEGLPAAGSGGWPSDLVRPVPRRSRRPWDETLV
jgi:serine/threonine-protein kinase